MIAIEIRDAVKSYPGFTLGPINLTVGEGEFFGIFGPPSTGKTSILKLMLGLLRPDSGQVLLAGRDARPLDVSERDIAMVFQNLALFPHMTGRENIVFPLVERGASEEQIARKLDFVSEVLHVSHILHKHPAQMSGGERQRIALGRAFAADSRAMLLDEPIAALDARLREEMRVELKRLQRENNQTFVYVSHDEEEVMAISDRVAVVIGGQIAQIGTPDEVYDQPGCRAVAEVIGTPPMSFFDGRVSAEGQRFQSDLPGLSCALPVKAAPGSAMTLGIRPEDIWIGNGNGDAAADGGIATRVMVSSLERLGGHTIVNATLGGKLVKIRAPGQIALTEGASVAVTFDDRKLHLFDARGERLQASAVSRVARRGRDATQTR